MPHTGSDWPAALAIAAGTQVAAIVLHGGGVTEATPPLLPLDSLTAGAQETSARAGAGASRRIAWTIADQALSSASNLGTGMVAARALDRRVFGAFGLAFTLYTLALGGCRGLVTEPLVGTYSHVSPTALRKTVRSATGGATEIGIAISILLGAATLLLGGSARSSLIALAIVLPGLLLQDAWRYCFVTAGRPRAAVFNDAIWCTIEVVVLTVLAVAGRLTLVNILLAWGAAGTLAGVVGCAQAAVTPAPWSAWRWFHQHRELSARYFTEFVVASGASQATLVGLGAVAGLAALGAIRGGQIFFGPIAILFSGAYLALGAEGVRLRADPQRLRRIMFKASLVLMVVGAIWLTVGVAVPAGVGRRLFGDTWGTARGVIVPLGACLIGGCAAAGAIVGLRALAAARASLRARLLGLPFVVVCPLVGAVGGARGFATGMALGAWVGAGIWWRQFANALRDRSRASPVGSGSCHGS